MNTRLYNCKQFRDYSQTIGSVILAGQVLCLQQNIKNEQRKDSSPDRSREFTSKVNTPALLQNLFRSEKLAKPRLLISSVNTFTGLFSLQFSSRFEYLFILFKRNLSKFYS